MHSRIWIPVTLLLVPCCNTKINIICLILNNLLQCLKMSSIMLNSEHDRLVGWWVCLRNRVNEAQTIVGTHFAPWKRDRSQECLCTWIFFPYQKQQWKISIQTAFQAAEWTETLKFRGKFKLHLVFNPASTAHFSQGKEQPSAPFHPHFKSRIAICRKPVKHFVKGMDKITRQTR